MNVRESMSTDPREDNGTPGEKSPLGAAGDETVQQHARKLNLVGSSQLTKAVAASVREGLADQFEFTPLQLNAAVRAVGSRLMARLKAQSKAVRGVPKAAFLKEVQADKERIDAARETAKRELDAMLEKLKAGQEENNRREAELVRESQETGQVEDEQLATRIAEIFASGDESTIREKITELALGSMQGQRDKSIDAQMSEHREQVDSFERRIAKLTNSLELTEEELKKMAKAKNIDLGVGSIYRSVQGLSGDDNDYETKKELMSSIFAANLELQKGKPA
jgi:hypothetical protein